MISAFQVHPSIATKHEQLIANVMFEFEKKVKRPRFAAQPSPSGPNKGMSLVRKAKMEKKWADIATRMRECLKEMPGAKNSDLEKMMGVPKCRMSAWTHRMREDKDLYGIGWVCLTAPKRFHYWRIEDLPQQGDE